jgi:phosphomannomutase
VGDLASIFKAYDIRGVVPDQLNEDVAEAVGAAFARQTGARTILTVHDMRTSSALHVLAALGGQPEPLSRLLAEYSRYHASGEINSQVADQAEATRRVRLVLSGRPGVSTDELDGLTVADGDWWFNLRPSNTEPLLRLNVEAGTQAAMAALRGEVLGIVGGGPHSAAS